MSNVCCFNLYLLMKTQIYNFLFILYSLQEKRIKNMITSSSSRKGNRNSYLFLFKKIRLVIVLGNSDS